MEIKEFFEPVLNFIKNLQKKDKEPASKQAAKDRLKLVLMQDRASVSPDFFEMMKKEIIDVIKKYIEIDEEALEVELTRGLEAGLEGPALYANIPIKNVKPIAPKGENDDYIEQEDSRAMTEEEAEKTAENILNSIENMSSKESEETIVVDEIKSEEIIDENDEEDKEDKENEPEVENVKKEVKSKAKPKTKTKTAATTQRKKATIKKKE